MEIHKFGGASICNADRIKALPSILSSQKPGKKIVIVSALGKTTNALEMIAQQYFEGNKALSCQLLASLKQSHLDIAQSVLSPNAFEICKRTFDDLFDAVKAALDQHLTCDYNCYYDQVVSFGELFSSRMVCIFLQEQGIQNCWVDARKVIKTNDHFREAGVLWEQLPQLMSEHVEPLFYDCPLVITQGFIGSTTKGESTTLGREGSDFTAAVFANILKAESVTIWKDVDGVMNGDPKEIEYATVIPHLDYKEVIEMAYYGAQVIHPKTIKPLQNESIPLRVRSFLNPSSPGTVINGTRPEKLPAMIVYKRDQVFVSFETKDFSFIEGKPAKLLNEIFSEALIKANLTQNTAISLIVCCDDIPEKRARVRLRAGDFEIAERTGLTLLTIRHYTPRDIDWLTRDKVILLEQRTAHTVQILYET